MLSVKCLDFGEELGVLLHRQRVWRGWWWIFFSSRKTVGNRHIIHVTLIVTSPCITRSTYTNLSFCLELCLCKKCEMRVTNAIHTIIESKALCKGIQIHRPNSWILENLKNKQTKTLQEFSAVCLFFEISMLKLLTYTTGPCVWYGLYFKRSFHRKKKRPYFFQRKKTSGCRDLQSFFFHKINKANHIPFLTVAVLEMRCTVLFKVFNYLFCTHGICDLKLR